MKFATIRLGKTSVHDIKTLSAMPQGIVSDSAQISVVCTQVPEDLDVGTIAFVWLGSDNSKGAATEWTQGFKVVGVVSNVDRGAKYNDESTTAIDLKYAFRESITRLDVLRESPDAYYWCSSLPIIGLDDHSNQTIRCFPSESDRGKVGAFLYALNSVQRGFKDEIIAVLPELADLFWTTVKSPKTGGVFGANTHFLRNIRSDLLAAIRAKPFILLAGMSGTGKTRIVRQLARGCCPTDSDLGKDPDRPGNYECIPVRPNWHDSTELMGYVTRLTENNRPKYVLTPFVKFLVKAWLHKDVPFFLCLDEMNLAPVEQYFAEYLSKIETRRPSGGEIVTDVLVEFPDEILDSALSEISREIPLMAMTKHPGADEKPETKKRDKDTLYKLWDDFLTNWPISRLREIGLEEYTKAGSTTTFTYALEVKLADLGSIWGGSAFKFGIFSRDPNGKMKDYNPNSKQIGTNEYAWYRKFGVTKEAAWNAVKEKIVSIAEAAANGNFAAIDKIDFPHIVKWKIAFLYQDRKNIRIVDIYKKEWVVLLTSGMPRNATFVERYLKLNEDRKDMDVFEWDDKILTKRRAELLGSDDDFDSDEEEESNPVDTMVQSPVLEMIKRDNGIRIPPNLVVMGTVNMDETTCSFPRKVLDRAMTFELNEFDVDSGLESNPDIALGSIDKGLAKCSFTHGWQVYAANKDVCDKLKPYLVALDKALKGEHGTPFRFAYRTRDEFMAYCVERIKDGTPLSAAADEATSMKILSRIEGDEQVVKKGWLQNLKTVAVDELKKLMVDGDPNPTATESKLDEMLGRLDYGSTSFWF